VRKTENWFGFGFQKSELVQKFDVRSDGFPTETARNLQFKLKVTKNNFTCTQCADKDDTHSNTVHSS